MKIQIIQNILRISEVVKTLTNSFFNFLSLDQNEHFNFNANAIYSISLGSGHILEASEINSLNSMNGINSIFEEANINNISKSSLEILDFSKISSLCFLTSSNRYSGAYNLNFSEKNNSQVLPEGETKIDMMTLASTTNSIQYSPGFSFMNLSCSDLFIFLPNFKASFSESLDFEEITFNNLNCEIFPLIASLATADQLISSNVSISTFSSSGTDNVIVDMFSSLMFNIFNIHNTHKIFKGFGD